MKVVVRVRPENDKEINTRAVVQILDSDTLLFDPKEQEEEFYFQGSKQNFRDLRKRANKELRFNFAHVFDGETSNEAVYEATTAEIIDDFLNGFNCSVFAYGPTGAGKTYTMLGNAETPGITYMTMRGVYDSIQMCENKNFDVAVTYIEIYNEELKDLLTPVNSLKILEDPRRGVLVSGITFHKPKSASELFTLLMKGNENRCQHSTDANAESSRSHAVFTVYVNISDRGCRVNGDKRGKMSFIDLAGSERATAISKNKVPRLREGANINKSLLALGNCINALADNKAKTHIPYRDSKLTRLLKDSLGGNCKTIMIAAVSPSQLSYEDTYNTLKYADRAQCIKVDAKQNVRTNDKSLTQYIKLVNELNSEVASLKTELATKEAEIINLKKVQTRVMFTRVEDSSQSCKQAEEVGGVSTNQNFRSNFAEICSKQLQLQSEVYLLNRHLRDFEFRVCRKEAREHLLQCVDPLSGTDSSSYVNYRQRLNSLREQREEMGRRMEAIDSEKCQVLKSSNVTDEDRAWMEAKNNELKWESMLQKNVSLKRNVQEMDENNCTNTKLLALILPLFKRQFNLLVSHGHNTRDVIEDFEKVKELIREYKDITWADETQQDSPEDTKEDYCNVELKCLQNIDWSKSSLNSKKRPFSEITDSVSNAANLPDQEDEQLNSTFTKDSPLKPTTASLSKFNIFKTSVLTAQRKSPPLMKRNGGAPLANSNRLNRALSASTSDLHSAKKKKLSPSKNGNTSPQGAQFKMDLAQIRTKRREMSRAHPYNLFKPRRVLVGSNNKDAPNGLGNENGSLPKQTLTSILRAKKPGTRI